MKYNTPDLLLYNIANSHKDETMVIRTVKSIYFWLVLVPSFYVLGGFFLLPWLIQTQLPSLAKSEYHLSVSLEEVTFNPLTFELHVKNLTLYNERNEALIRLGHGYVNYHFLALFKKEIILSNLHLDELFVDAQLSREGHLNLMEPLSSLLFVEQNATESTNTSLPFSITHTEINKASARFSDFAPEIPFTLDIGPLDYTINNLSFEKNDLSIHALKLALQNHEKITLASSVSFDPFVIHGELKINDLILPPFWHYLLPKMPAKLNQGSLFATLPFTLDLSRQTPLFFLEKASISLQELLFHDPKEALILHLPKIDASGLTLSWPESKLLLETLFVAQPTIHLELDKTYTPSLVALFTLPNPEKNPETNASTPWEFTLKTLQLDEGNITFIDTNTHHAKTSLSHVALIAKDISSDLNQTINYALSTTIDAKANIASQGSYHQKTQTLHASLDAKALPLSKLQPYLEPYTPLKLTKGELSTQASFQLDLQEDLKALFKGSLIFSFLNINDALGKSLLSWDTLALKEIVFDTHPLVLHVNHIALEKPYVNLDIKKDKSTNFSTLLKPSNHQKSPKKSPSKKKENPLHLRIGDVVLKQGKANFKDASLPIPFATLIQNLNGTFSTLDTKNSKPSVLKLEGKVDKYGYANIGGSLLAFDFKNRANLKILFKNIDMPSLTPYSGKFVGYAIKQGKLSMDLSYKIQKGLMEGENKINLDSLTLGEKIESEEATNLPLGLAIAILKDSQGQIDIDLPVSGDLNSPDFKYGALVWKAIGNLLGSVITSPFSLIGSILGIETQALKSIDFAAGERELIASEEEKMEDYKKILEKKPELKLRITPSYNEIADTKALQEKALDTTIEKLSKNAKNSDDSYAKALKELFIERFSSEAYKTLLQKANEENLDQGAINDRVKNKLLATFTLAPDALTTLARQRADAILRMMTQKYAIPSHKLLTAQIETSDTIREKWIGCAITISN